MALGRWLGVLSNLVAITFWLVFVGANPYARGGIGGATTGIVCLMVLLALAGVLVSLRQRLGLMYLLFAVSFLPMGFYTLGTPGIFRFIGVADLFFLCAAVVTHVSTRRPGTASASSG